MANIHSVYAKVVDNTIVDIMVCNDYELANRIARATHGDTATAICIDDYSVGIGDKFHDNQFFTISDDGAEIAIEQVSTTEDDVKELTAKIEYLSMMTGVKTEVSNE
ncbi:hypothetical protein [Clostridium sp. E02]|uniref:hypothetical protein n=1 Tax=Clostridium sp. E02 TaxID=2487134 RepID=UPI000F532194|nr:hypothetical protein [Clostridium sp. E02]